MLKIHVYELQEGDVITSLVLDPDEHFVVDQIDEIEDADIVIVQGYTQDTGESFKFTWGTEKALTVERTKVTADE